MTQIKILVVDDNPINLTLASYALISEGFVVETATDGASALDRVASFWPDRVLMDVQMPGMDGLEATRQIKANAATRHIVVVALTACAMKGDEARMREAGCDGYLAKPMDVATLGQKVRGYL
jgi:two-component system cell cycle response regulator DivK